MHRFKRIGLLLDLTIESNLAINYAKNLAKSNQGNIYVIIATKEPLKEKYQKQIRQKVDELIGESHCYAFLDGTPIHRISAYVKANSLDIIITEPDQTQGLRRFFYGSLTLTMLRRVPCPIWVTKANNPENNYQKVLICVDPISDDDNKRKLNQKLIEIGTSFAKRENAECHLMTAWYYYGESSINGPFIRMPEDEVKKLITDYKIKIAHAFEKLQNSNKQLLDGCQTHLIHGQPQKVIPKFIDKENIDMVIMGTLARTGVQGFVIGNTAESIINQLDCSILAIKPDDFQLSLR